MKLIDTMHDGENLDFCKPYTDGKGHWLVEMDGEVIQIGFADGGPDEVTDEAIRDLAKAVNPHYAEYKGWSDAHIAKEAMTETGCTDCPWRDVCEAVNREEEE